MSRRTQQHPLPLVGIILSELLLKQHYYTQRDGCKRSEQERWRHELHRTDWLRLFITTALLSEIKLFPINGRLCTFSWMLVSSLQGGCLLKDSPSDVH